MNVIKKAIIVLLMAVAFLPGANAADYLFRFRAGSDMLYRDINAGVLDSLSAVLSGQKERILSGEIPLYVEGYAATLETARVRSNRVKSELIGREGLVEDCFITTNKTDGGDYVTVKFSIPADNERLEQNKTEEADDGPDIPEVMEEPTTSGEVTGSETAYPSDVSENVTSEVPLNTLEGRVTCSDCGGYNFAVRANLLRWATLTPDLGIEWRVNHNVGIAVHGSWTSWSWDNKSRRYALWEIAPEVRWYLGKWRRGYVGAMYKAGSFNYKLSATGRQGDLMGGGITGGYQLRLNDALSLDFSLAVGCLHADYENYVTVGGVRVFQNNEHKNWWGPINAGVTLVWRPF